MSQSFSMLTNAARQAPAAAGRVRGGAALRGFTLMEMLVVLVITSLAAGLLMQASTQVLGLQARLNAQLDGLRGPALGADWLRQVVQGLQPDYDDGANRFRGSARGFAGLTTNALSGSYGGLEPFAVVLEHDEASNTTALRYAPGARPGVVAERMADALPDGAAAPVLMRWPGTAPSLRYWDERGDPHDEWPPAQQGRWRPLPSRITLEGGQEDAPWAVVATLWVLALVAVVAVFFAERMGQARALALAAQARNQALLDLSGARADMLYRLATTPVSLYGLGQDPATALALDDRPYHSLGDTLVQVQDNRGLLNLNIVDDERLGRFLGVLGVPPERRSALIDALRDYADEDNLKRLNGAEAAEYATAGLPPPRNAKLVAPLEARRVYGWAQAPELWKDDVLHRLTTTGTSFSMNPNTAPWQVLAAMRNMTPEGVQAIMAARKLAPIVGPQQVVALTGVQIFTDPMLADVVALPADSWRVTQRAPGMGWGWRYNVSLTPVSDFAPWRIDYFYRVELPTQNVQPQAPSPLPERSAGPAVTAPGLFPTP